MTETEFVVIDSANGKCFLTRIEEDLGKVIASIYNKFGVTLIKNVRNCLKKGSIFHQGEFFMSLSCCNSLTDRIKKELLDKVQELPYIRAAEIDSKVNLILYLKRTVLFKSILKDVLKYNSKYGIETNKFSFLILVHNEVFKNFDSLRIAVIANHLISFLTATGAKVFVNEYRKDAELAYKQVPTYPCTDLCFKQISSIGELIKNSIRDNKYKEWTSIIDTESINIDLKKYVNSLQLWLDAGHLVIRNNSPNVVINQGACTIHFKDNHFLDIPDYIIHVCSNSQKQKIADSSVLIEMLDLVAAPQLLISCETTIFKAQSEVSISTFMDCVKSEIETYMAHKFNSSINTKDTLDGYLKILVDTAIKFYFLRAGTNVPLKIDFDSTQSNVKHIKDGIFVQYNFARLSNLLKNFEVRQQKMYYEKLPEIDEVDFRLLKLEEEWQLLNFIFSFPRLVHEMSYTQIFSKKCLPINKICIMLIELCHHFSRYYSRIHILREPQPHLQNVMHARLWLLKGVYQIMYNSFTLLNIEGLNKM